MSLSKRRAQINTDANLVVIELVKTLGSKAKLAKKLGTDSQNINRWYKGLKFTDASLKKISPKLYEQRKAIEAEILSLVEFCRSNFSCEQHMAHALGASHYSVFLWLRGRMPSDEYLDKIEALANVKKGSNHG